jgi:hypothetical protein
LAVRFGTGFFLQGVQWFIAGWSSPVARQAHNLKVIGSNPIPATKIRKPQQSQWIAGVLFWGWYRLPVTSFQLHQ